MPYKIQRDQEMMVNGGTTSRNRELAVDALRGVGIAAVVLSHIVSQAVVSERAEPLRVAMLCALYMANVQVLAFVSGYVMRESSISHRARNLLIPLASWITLEALISCSGIDVLFVLPDILHGVFTGGTRLWYLWALFIDLAVVGLFVRNQSALLWLAVLACIIWPVFPFWSLVRGAVLLLPFIVLGMTWRETPQFICSSIEKGLMPIALVSGSLTLILFWHIRSPLWIGAVVPLHLLPFSAAAMVMSALVCIGLLGLMRILRGYTLKVLALLGTASMGVYGFHGILVTLFPSAFRAYSLPEIGLIWAVLIVSSVALTWPFTLSRFLSVLFLGGRTPHWRLLHRAGILEGGVHPKTGKN